jgi:hypothetical protein
MSWVGATSASAAATYVSNGTPDTIVTNSQGANLSVRIEKLVILNTDVSSAVTVTVYKVLSGGAISGDDWKVVKAFSVLPSDGVTGTEDIREVAGDLLANGDSLRLLAGTATKLRYSLSFYKES